jgi:thioredoxin 1
MPKQYNQLLKEQLQTKKTCFISIHPHNKNMSKPIELTDENLEETLSSSSVPVLVDYWAEWCGPCKMVAPVLEELAAELDGKLTIGKVDVDSNRDSAAKQNVMSIPTLILFKDGQPIDQRIGALTKNQLQDFINEHI